jgi:hypothetical protein
MFHPQLLFHRLTRGCRLVVGSAVVGVLVWSVLFGSGIALGQSTPISETQIKAAIDGLVATHGENQRARIDKGVRQTAQMWRTEDGTPQEFEKFCGENFVADSQTLQQTTDHFEQYFESIYGHFAEMGRDLSWYVDVESGPILPIDYSFAQYAAGAHFSDDMFKMKIAFIALLNYPQYTLEERLRLGPSWTREQWAQARLAQVFTDRVPANISQRLNEVYVSAGDYISQYNIWMHHVLTPEGKRLFPKGLRLLSHWNLRDELKSQYVKPDGLARQDMIYEVMLKIIRQEIPAVVINNPGVDWQLATCKVTVSADVDGDVPVSWAAGGVPGTVVDNAREPDARYAHVLDIFHAQRAADPYYPTAPTLMQRSFDRGREIPEAEAERMFTTVMSSPTIKKVANLIEKRLGRRLRPFDIWYAGFRPSSGMPEEELDRIVAAKYPTAAAFEAGIPSILGTLGFDPSTTQFLISHIQVDPARGSGHASAPGRPVDKAHLRTRVAATGMNYKGYNIATHELGHNVEQVFSTTKVDHVMLRSVPNTAFTEGFAYVFKNRNLEFLGVARQDPLAESLNALNELWSTYEIAGVSLVDMNMWNWLYAHPNATPAELREAVIAIAKDIWNKYYAPIFGVKDVAILAIYSHMIDNGLYLPDYTLGHIIAFPVEQHMRTANLAAEIERMCKIGNVTPDQWMKEAVGSPISTAPLLKAAEDALKVVKK